MATRKPVRSRARSRRPVTLRVTIGRFGQDPAEISVRRGTTLRVALAEAGIDIGPSEELFLNSQPAELTDEIDENNSIVNIVGRKAGGVA